MKFRKVLLGLIMGLLWFSLVSCSETTTSSVIFSSTTQPIDYSEPTKVVFYSGRTGNNEIFVMDLDGSNLTNLTNNDADDECPTVSPNGSTVAYVSNRTGNFELYLELIYGGTPVQLTDSGIDVTQPSWSYDGTSLLYVLDYGSKTEIWKTNADGSDLTKLTDNSYRDERPVFSPNGQGIMFMSNREGKYRIYTMDSDGTNQSKIDLIDVEASSDHFIFPQYSPDGQYIIYSLNNLTNQTAVIHRYKLDGTEDVILTEIGGRNENPSYSLDGEWIVFQSERDGNFEVYMMKSDGTGVTRLTNNSSWDGWPAFASLHPQQDYES
ncbi:MAG: PD40 domain-containing protein [Bacilli bacterium]|nr:PD40 domain-containing protein [Bacilli bacterium]